MEQELAQVAVHANDATTAQLNDRLVEQVYFSTACSPELNAAIMVSLRHSELSLCRRMIIRLPSLTPPPSLCVCAAKRDRSTEERAA